MILFRINWRCGNRVFLERRIFNNNNSHVWLEVNRHTASDHSHQQHFAVNVWAGIVHDVFIGLYLLPRRLTARIYWAFLEEKLPEACGSSMTGVRATLHFRSDNISPQIATIAGLEDVDLWLGLPVHRTLHQRASSYGATLKHWFARHRLILKMISLPVSLRQQQLSGSNLTILSAHVTL